MADNTIFGTGALGAVTTGDFNAAFGTQAGAAVSTGSRNSVFGYRAGDALASGADNSAFGQEALGILAAGQGNVAIGSRSGIDLALGDGNVFVGLEAGGFTGQATTIYNSVAIGYRCVSSKSFQVVLGNSSVSETVLRGRIVLNDETALQLWPAEANYFVCGAGPEIEPTGLKNFAAGWEAGMSITGAIDCTFLGAGAGRLVLNGVGACAMGRLALASATEAAQHTAIGDSTLRYTTTGIGCVALGYTAAENNVTGSFLTIVGTQASYANISGDQNCIFGAEAFNRNISGSRVVAAGYRALFESLGSEDTAVGWEAGREMTSGSRLTALGFRAGWRLETGVDCVFVGHDAGANGLQKVDAQNAIAIGAGSYTTANNQVVLGNPQIVETVLRGVQRSTTYTVATLPAANLMGVGARAFVTDSNTAVFNKIPLGAGTNKVPVFSDGVSWRVG